MKTNYEMPQVEVIAIELEGAICQASVQGLRNIEINDEDYANR